MAQGFPHVVHHQPMRPMLLEIHGGYLHLQEQEEADISRRELMAIWQSPTQILARSEKHMEISAGAGSTSFDRAGLASVPVRRMHFGRLIVSRSVNSEQKDCNHQEFML